MLRRIFLILSAILFAVSAVTYFFNVDKAREMLGLALIAFSLHLICFIAWGTETVHKRP